MKIIAIILAGGSSCRFGSSNKLLTKINGKEIISYTIDAFNYAKVDEIVICANKSIISDLQTLFPYKIIEGGATRQESVYNCLNAIDCDFVLIHDGARPVITSEIINQVIDVVKEKKAVTLMTKTIDTIKEVLNGKIVKTLDRSVLYNTQTPQAFKFDLIKLAHEKLKGQNFTDDAGMLETLGVDVYKIDGDYKNIKITMPSDLELAKLYLK